MSQARTSVMRTSRKALSLLDFGNLSWHQIERKYDEHKHPSWKKDELFIRRHRKKVAARAPTKFMFPRTVLLLYSFPP